MILTGDIQASSNRVEISTGANQVFSSQEMNSIDHNRLEGRQDINNLAAMRSYPPTLEDWNPSSRVVIQIPYSLDLAKTLVDLNSQMKMLADSNSQAKIMGGSGNQAKILEDSSNQARVLEDSNSQARVLGDSNSQARVLEDSNSQTRILESFNNQV